MAYKRFEIADGICLNLIDTQKFKTNHLAINFVAGLDKATAAMNALLLRVLKRGSEAYPTMLKLNRALDMIYSGHVDSRVFKVGDSQVFGLSLTMLDNAYSIDGTNIAAAALDVLVNLIYKPLAEGGAFKAEYVESEKRNLKDDIAAKINNKNAYAMERGIAEMCRDEVYSLSEIGTAADVDVITPASLYEHYMSVISTLRMEVFFVGRFDEKSLIATFERTFKAVRRGTICPITTSVVRSCASSREIVEEMAVNQGKMTIGFRSGTVLTDGAQEWAKFALFNEIFGGSPNSKLFLNVREKLSLCYYCRTVPDAQKGLLLVACGIENDNKLKAQDEIMLQLELMKKGDFDDEDISFAKKSLINGYMEIDDAAVMLEMWYLRRAIVGMSDSPQDMADCVRSVNKQDIIDAANKIVLDTIYFLKGTLTSEQGDAADED